MKTRRSLSAAALVAAATLGLAPATATAQPTRSFTVALMGGLGGAADGEPDTGLDNFGYQALFSLETDFRTHFVVRVGSLDLGAGGAAFDTQLRYVTLAGEYRFAAGYYESGLYVGLGAYDRTDAPLLPGDSGLGLALGATGDFRLAERFSLLVELSGHYADLDDAHFFLMGHAGVAYHF